MLVPLQLLDSVVFLGQHTNTGDKIGGTAFFASVPSELWPEHRHVYLVTARHVVEGQLDLFARLNRPASGGGGTFQIDLPDGDSSLWLIHPGPPAGQDYVDLTVVKLAAQDATAAHTSGYGWVGLSMFLDESLLGNDANAGVGIGDEVVAVGLLNIHYGQDRNEPVVRTGNLAMVPSEPVLVRYKQHALNRRMRLYLTELRSISGLSGSPVFIRHRNFIGADQTKVSLLGVMIGHWDDDASNHMGFGKVVPAELLSEVINQQAAVDRRNAEEAKGSAKPDPG